MVALRGVIAPCLSMAAVTRGPSRGLYEVADAGDGWLAIEGVVLVMRRFPHGFTFFGI